MLALVLALSFVAPISGYADDLAYHGDDHRHAAELTALGSAHDVDAADPGLACHLHCGCHQVVPLTTGLAEPFFEAVRPTYVRSSEALTSVAPDRLPRPPRA